MTSIGSRIDPSALFLNLHRCIEREWKTILFRFELKNGKNQSSDSSDEESDSADFDDEPTPPNKV
jgi:hypothetical protein